MPVRTRFLSSDNQVVREAWQALDAQGLEKLRQDVMAERHRSKRKNILRVFAVPLVVAVVFGVVVSVSGVSGLTLALALFNAVFAVLVVPEWLRHRDRQDTPRNERNLLLGALSMPLDEEEREKVLELARTVPRCEAYCQAVLATGRELVWADLKAMRQLQAEGSGQKTQGSHKVPAQPGLEDGLVAA